MEGLRVRAESILRLTRLSAVLLFSLGAISQARAGATLLLGEPYGYDGALAGTGHAGVYLSRICASSPVVLRLCEPGETGIVISRYLRVAGYDWVAIPLIPYLYGVEKPEDIPLYADRKLVAFLRDRYRRNHLESIAPDLPDGGTPDGNWYELIGASYIRTIYTFEIETSLEQDEKLIRRLNESPNHQHWNLVTANCADFARQIISFYYPHSVHRSIIGDLGVTTPKQLARTLSKYSRCHPELQSSSFMIPQVPGTIPRSKRVRGVLEVAVTAKKYMLPLFLLNPYIAGSMVAVYVGHWHYNPAKDKLILDSKHQLDSALTATDRRAVQDRLEELVGTGPSSDAAGRRASLGFVARGGGAGVRCLRSASPPGARKRRSHVRGHYASQYPKRLGRPRVCRGTGDGTLARRIKIHCRPKNGSRRCRARSGAAATTPGAAAESFGHHWRFRQERHRVRRG